MNIDKCGLVSDAEMKELSDDFVEMENTETISSAAGAAAAPIGSAAGGAAGAAI